MLVREAEERFRQGMRHLARGRAREALPFIAAAVDVQTQTDATAHCQATYLSYQGLCLCLTRSGVHSGVRLCRRASEMDPCNPEIWRNLGSVTLMVGRRAEAYRAFQEGLRVQAEHPGIVRDLRRMGIRSRPVLPSLARSNPINVLLGRLGRLCGSHASP
jgi:predicted Zn-dependent protease